MAVNGIDIEVGQKWKSRGGAVVLVQECVGADPRFPYRVECVNDARAWTINNDGYQSSFETPCNFDLLELIEDPAGDFMGVSVKGGVSPEPTARLVPTAPDLLDKAAAHMRERAATYDSPGGERSMAKTVALFNLHHDMALTEAQGWHFMQILKDVRLFSAKGYHADSAEDKIAYAALMSEAKAKEGV